MNGKGRVVLNNEKLEIFISEKVKIKEYDDRNYILLKLVENRNNQTGEMVESWKNVGYYSTVKKALNAVISKDLLIDKSVISNILDYKKETDKQYETILELLK